MDTTRRNTRAAAVSALALLLAAGLLSNACRGGGQKAEPAANLTASAQPNAAASPADIAQLDGEIERLEKQAERNPADDETQDELARAYVKRAKAEQSAGQHQEALADYQRALRYDPDNVEAAAGAAAVNQELGGAGKEDENFAPAPPPISPNVADEGGKPTPTPKRQ